ncbi:aldo/keto reductase [Pleomorphovibrio marinus]|uniref:aldo/keto reductase n=1 Tax=Pleomorphovibrio marinus TaxID=2164132 RepID=UPI000E0B83B4|nr:aldo/keto reductase [Pleomorphovibrio marinus]
MEVSPFGNTGLSLPKVVFGSSDLGNLYRETPLEDKLATIQSCVELTRPYTVIDSAGKYGAGLALEVIGDCLHNTGVKPEEVVISNKLGWLRSPLVGEEPTFEPGIWKGIKHDAKQVISYEGILECFEEGNKLLKHYVPQLVSVHDPDEYLDAAKTSREKDSRFEDIIGAYKALAALKEQGKVAGVGVGAKNWKVIPEIYKHVKLDWVMIANSLTVYSHPKELLEFVDLLAQEGVGVIDAAVFHGGFLVGGDLFNYKPMRSFVAEDKEKLVWRKAFFEVCQKHQVKPSHACVQFALLVPGVNAVALSTVDASRAKENFRAAQESLPGEFWEELKSKELIADLSFI